MRAGLIAVSAALGILSSAAWAADLPNIKGPPVFAAPPPPAFSWTGPYIGAQVGYEWGNSENAYFAPSGIKVASGDHNDEGVVGGGHIGYNYQISQFVIGIEGDANGASYDGTGTLHNSFGVDILRNHVSTEFDGSIRGRVGVAFERVLFYGTGGAAFGSIRNTADNLITGGFDSQTTGRAGWTAGGGVEYAIDNNWSVRAEYRYTDYGYYNFVLVNSTAAPLTFRTHETDNRVQAGFSYKFDLFAPPGPVAAKY